MATVRVGRLHAHPSIWPIPFNEYERFLRHRGEPPAVRVYETVAERAELPVYSSSSSSTSRISSEGRTSADTGGRRKRSG